MQRYERFIIYPLLVFCLFQILTGIPGLGARQAIFERLVTRKLIVANDDQEMLLPRITLTPDRMAVKNSGGERVVHLGSDRDAGFIETRDEDGRRKVVIFKDPDGYGAVYVYDREGKRTTEYGY